MRRHWLCSDKSKHAVTAVAAFAFVAMIFAAGTKLNAQQPKPALQTATPQNGAKSDASKSDPSKPKQRIAQLKKLKLIEILDMNEQTAEKFFVRYNADQKKVDDALKALNDAMRELDKALDQDPKKSTPEQVKPLNDAVLERQAQMQAAVAERLRSLRGLLDERQYAKFLLFEAKFQEQVRKTLLDVKRDVKKEAEAQKK
jgi:hypothetical protein